MKDKDKVQTIERMISNNIKAACRQLRHCRNMQLKEHELNKKAYWDRSITRWTTIIQDRRATLELVYWVDTQAL